MKLAPVTTDTTPPAAILDLSVTGPLSRTVTLTWTAPGDDGTEGLATAYELRYATHAFEEAGWDSAKAHQRGPSMAIAWPSSPTDREPTRSGSCPPSAEMPSR